MKKLQLPEFLTRRPAFLTRKPARPPMPKTLRAATAARRMSPAMEDEYEDEPTTRLSSAFFVVLILHLVAVGGIWAFNSIKAHRRGIEPPAKIAAAKLAAEKPTVPTPPAPAPAVPTEARPNPALAAPLTFPPTSAGSARSYVVKPNDNLTKIAAVTGVTLVELQAANNPKDLSPLRVGQTLNIPARKTAERMVASDRQALAAEPVVSSPMKADAAHTYAVKKGDTATSIAKRFGVTVDELLRLNKVSDPKKLQLGQALKVPAKKVN